MRRVKKFTSSLVVALAISAACGLSVSAGRDQGAIGDVAAYDYSLKDSFFPWGDVKGYTNTTFIVSDSIIDSGFVAYSYLYIQSDDLLASTERTVYVQKGTNYAQTGDIKLDGYSKNCHSTHKSVYLDGGIYFSRSLESSD